MVNTGDPPVVGLKNWQRILFSSGVIILIWLVAVLIVALIAPSITQAAAVDAPRSYSDLATLLFGATSIALIILSLVLSILAFFGWSQIRQSIREDVDKASIAASKALKEEIAKVNTGLRDEMTRSVQEQLRVEMRGRNLIIFGYMLGKLALKSDRPELEQDKAELLRDAVDTCQGAFDLLEKSGGAVEYLALNNLVYFASIHASTKPEALPGRQLQSKTWLIEKARALLKAAKEHSDGSPRTIPLLLTYCCTISLFSQVLADLQEALAIAKELSARDDASSVQKGEAQYFQASLTQKIKAIQATTG